MVRLIILCALLLASNAFVMHDGGLHPPSIYAQTTARTVYFAPRGQVELRCIATGNPEPTYRWLRNGYPFLPSGTDDRIIQKDGEGTLVFNAAEDKDEGVFQCTASNGYGTSVGTKFHFREARLGHFYYQENQQHGVYIGDSLTLPCTPPVSYPPGRTAWAIRAHDGTMSPVIDSKDITIDLDGRLRFVSVQKAQEGVVYVCVATNFFLRETRIGNEHTINVYGTVPHQRPVGMWWSSPTDTFFLKGGTFRLMCIFNGNPSPDVTWHRVNGNLSSNAVLEDFGKTLRIDNVQLSDAGEYVCRGTNALSVGPVQVTFTVYVESVPSWTNQPQFIEKRVGETATFICQAAGTPDPVYKWYINGVALADVRDPRIHYNARFSYPTANNITLTNLTLEDRMNIQCNATNKHGYVFSDVSLNVIV